MGWQQGTKCTLHKSMSVLQQEVRFLGELRAAELPNA